MPPQQAGLVGLVTKLTAPCAVIHSAATARSLYRSGIERDETKDTTQGLFRKDLYQAFAIGFLIGTAGLAASIGGDARSQIAAEVAQLA